MLKMGKSITVNNVDLGIVEHKGENVVTFNMIDRVHERPEGTAKRNFVQNKSRFLKGKHFYLIDFTQKNVFRSFDIDIPPRGLTVITERGYLLLVKSFTDDLAWDVQEKLIDGYFQSKVKVKVLTPGQQLALQAQFMIDTERRQLAIEQSQWKTEVAILETKQKIDELESKMCSNPGYFTVTGYANLMKVSVTTQEANKIGRKAAKLSRESNTAIGKSSHERWGEVNTYHENILQAIFPRK
jgi:hypothetical protein